MLLFYKYVVWGGKEKTTNQPKKPPIKQPKTILLNKLQFLFALPQFLEKITNWLFLK